MSILQKISMDSIERRRSLERRKAKRLVARGAAVSIVHEAGIDAALCSNFSPSGMQLSLDTPLAIGDAVKVAFGRNTFLMGHVVWIEGADCGIEFEEPAVSTDTNTTNLAAAADRRGSRLPVPRGRFRDGLSVTVILPECERKAILHWTDDHKASLRLER